MAKKTASATPVNADDLIAQLAAVSKKNAAKKKTDVPSVDLPELNEHIDTWMEARTAMKDAEIEMGKAEKEILPKVEDARQDLSRQHSEFETSVRLNDRVLVTCAARYSAIDLDEFEGLKKLFGDRAADFFKAKWSLEPTESAMGDMTVLQRLLKAFGPDFQKLFNMKRSLTVTEEFHKARVMDPAVKPLADKLIENGVLRPQKLTMKPSPL